MHINVVPKLNNISVRTSTNHILSLLQTNVYKQLSQLTREDVTIQSPKTPREFMPDLSLNPSPGTRHSHWYHNPMVACSAFRFHADMRNHSQPHTQTETELHMVMCM